MSKLADLQSLAWKPDTLQEVHDEAATQGRRPARPGEQFRLVIHRDPSKHKKTPGLSINDINRVHMMQLHKFKLALAEQVRNEATAQRCPAFHNGTPYVRDFYHFKRRDRRDHRNYGKALIDALTTAGIIADDNDAAILLDRPGIITGADEPRIEVLLIDTRLMSAEDVADLFRASALEQCRKLLGEKGA